MRNVAPSRSLARRANQWKGLAFLVGAVGIFLTALAVLLRAIPFSAPSLDSYGFYLFVREVVLILGVGAIGAALAMAIRAFTWRTDNDLAQITARYLSGYLNDFYTLIRNVNRSELGYIDAVLVGPPGVLVFRILDNTGVFVNEQSNWLRQRRPDDWRPAPIKPTVEAVADIRKMREYLAKRGFDDTPVYGIIVFTRDQRAVQLMLREPVVPVAYLNALWESLQTNYLAKDRIEPAKAAVIADLVLGE